MNKTQIAAQLYTLRDSLKTPADIAKTLTEVRKIGYQAVQVSGLGPIDAKDLALLLEDNGLFCCSSHEPAAAILNQTDDVIGKLKILGCPTVAIPAIGEEYRSADGFRRLAAEASKAGEKMKLAGIELMYHNHAFEFEKYDGRLGLEILYEASDPKFLQAEIDTYWVQFGGGNPVDWCGRVRNRMPVVHLKDYAFYKDSGPGFAEIGNGNLDFKGIIAACEQGKVRWYAVEQDTCRRPPIESLRISFEYIRDNFCR